MLFTKEGKWRTGMHPISDSFCQITYFRPCTGPHVHSLHSSDHSKLSSSPILSQAPFPISASPFPHRKKKIFKIIWNTSLSYTFHFKVKLRRKKISESDFCKAPIQTDPVKLSSYRKVSRTAQVLCTGLAGHQPRSSQRRF